MKKSKYLLLSMLPFALLASTAFVSTAHAGVESAFLSVREETAECKDDQNKQTADWRPSSPRLQIAGDGTIEIEVYGQGIDLNTEAYFTGLPNPSSADIIDWRSGPTNNGKHCGAIASVVVKLNLPKVSGANHAILHIGNEQIPVSIYPKLVKFLEWNRKANRTPLPSVSRGSTANISSPPTSSPPTSSPPPVTVSSGNCPGPSGPGGCQTGPGISVKVSDSDSWGARGASDPEYEFNSLVKCAIPFGLKSKFNSEQYLSLELPEARSAQLKDCFNRPLYAEYNYISQYNAQYRAQSLNPTVPANTNITATDGLPVRHEMMNAYGGNRSSYYGWAKIFIDREYLANFVGRKTFTLDITPTYPDFPMLLELVSKPEFGPKIVAAPIFPQNVGSVNSIGRLKSDITFRVTPHYVASISQPYDWKIVSNAGPSISSCFHQTSGRVNSVAGANSIEIPLTVKENEICYNKPYSFEVYTITNPSLGANTPFDKTITFTLPPITRAFIPQNNGPQVTAPAGIRVNGN